MKLEAIPETLAPPPRAAQNCWPRRQGGIQRLLTAVDATPEREAANITLFLFSFIWYIDGCFVRRWIFILFNSPPLKSLIRPDIPTPVAPQCSGTTEGLWLCAVVMRRVIIQSSK